MGIYTEAVQKLYVAYFSRPADAAGLTYWEGVVTAAKGSTAAVSAAFAASAEYKAAYAGLDAYATVNQVYLNLFGRPAEPAGLQFWGQNLLNGKLTVDAVVTAIATGAQGTDLVAYNSKVAAATAFTAALDTSAEILGYSGAAANAGAANFIAGVTSVATLEAAVAPAALNATILAITTPQPVGTTFVLTDINDVFVGTSSNDTFTVTTDAASVNGQTTTLTTFDELNGGAGNDALNIIDPNTGAAAQLTINGAGAMISGIETVSIRTTGGAAADTTSMTGVTKLNVVAQGTAAVAATVAATTDVNVTSANVGTGVTVNGGKQVIVTSKAVGAGDVSVTGAALTTVAVTGGSNVVVSNTATGTTLTSASITGVTGASSTLTGTALTNLNLANIGLTAAHSVTVNNTTAGHAVNATLSAVGNSANVVTLTDNVATSANLSAITASNISLAGSKIATANITGAGALSLNAAGAAALTTIAGAAATGALTLTGLTSAVTSVATGSANDTVTLNAATTATVNASVVTGAGNDSITLNTSGAGTVSVVAGEGNDKVVVSGRGTGALNIDLGDGTDTLSATGASINFGDTVNAGAGVDTLTLALVGSANITAFKGFELFDAVGLNKDLDVDILVSQNTVTEIVASGNVGTATLTNVGPGVGFRATGDMAGSTLVLDQKTAGAISVTADIDEAGTADDTADVAAASVSLLDATSATIVFDSAYLVNSAAELLVAGDNVTTFNVAAAAATSATVVSGGALSNNVLNLTGTAAKLASLTITGAQALTLTSPGGVTVLANVDATAQTGGLIATTSSLANGGQFKLGSGVDKITIDLAASNTLTTTIGTTTVANAEQISGIEKTADVSLSAVAANATAKAAAQADADTIVLAGGNVAVDSTQAGVGSVTKGVLTFSGAGPANLTAAFGIADSFAATNEVLVFNYLGDSYVYMDGAANDVAVKLVGTIGITGLGEVADTGAFFIV